LHRINDYLSTRDCLHSVSLLIEWIYIFLFAASISFGRSEKTVGTRHGVDDSSSQQLVSVLSFT